MIAAQNAREKCFRVCETGTGQTMYGPVSHVKDSDLSPKTNGRPLLAQSSMPPF